MQDITAIVIFLVIGAVAGWLAGQIIKGGGFGLVGNIIVGIIGAIIGGVLFNFLGIATFGLLGSIISATVGAVIPVSYTHLVTAITGKRPLVARISSTLKILRSRKAGSRPP